MTRARNCVSVVAILLLATASACNGRRASECSALVERINAADAAVTKGGGTGDRSRRLADLARTVERERGAIAAVALRDAKLRQLRTRYMALLDTIARASKKLAEAHADDASAMQPSVDEIDAASAKEATILNDLNAYCQSAGR